MTRFAGENMWTLRFVEYGSIYGLKNEFFFSYKEALARAEELNEKSDTTYYEPVMNY